MDVAASAQALLRWAHLLTGDPERARRLAQRALASMPRSPRSGGEDADAALRRHVLGEHLAPWRRLLSRRSGPAPGDPLAPLSPRTRAVLVLIVHDGLDVPAVANLLDASAGAVRRELARALAGRTPQEVRDLLHDDAWALPVPAHPELGVQQRVRGRRRARAIVATVTGGALVLGGVVLFEEPPPPGLPWPPRGELAADPAVRREVTAAWDRAALLAPVRDDGGLVPDRAAPLRLLWAGRPSPAATLLRPSVRVAVAQAEVAGGGTWAVVFRSLGRGGPWVLQQADALPPTGTRALLLDIGTRTLGGREAGPAEVHVLAAPGATVETRTAGGWERQEVRDGLVGPLLAPPRPGRLLLRVDGQRLTAPCRALGPLLEQTARGAVPAPC